MNSILIYILTCIHSIYDFIIEKIYELYFLNSKRNLPPIENSPIILESAVDLATKIRKRQLSAESCVKSFIEHNKLINPYINAVVCNDFENALKEARNVDNYLKNTQETEEEIKKSKPFLGVPFSTKESTSVKGLSHTLAILARKNAKAIEDSDVISYMKEAGAIFLCLTNIPELNMWCETRNLIFGQTNNPYDLRKNVGGSSGGEAALLSACGSPFGIGTDIGGSIRMPAFFNGIFGHKPTTGLISLKGLTLRDDEVKDSMVCPGPMTKHAKDLAPMLEILLGPNKHLLKLDQEVPVEKINFFYIESINDLRISPLNKDMKYAMNKVLNYLKSKNIHPIKIEIEELKYSFKLWRYFMSKESMDFGSIISLEPNCRANPFKELFLKLIGKGRFTIAAIMNLLNTDYFPKENSEMCEELFKIILSKLEVLLGSNTVLLFPSSPYPANFHYTALWNPYNFGYWAAINVLKLPATQVPLGLTSKGMPIGVQVVASRFNDHLTISVAKELEKGLGGWVSPFSSKNKY